MAEVQDIESSVRISAVVLFEHKKMFENPEHFKIDHV